MFEKFLEKLRRDWWDHRRQMVIQIVTGITMGFLTVLFMKNKNPVIVLVLVLLAGINWKWGGIKRDGKS